MKCPHCSSKLVFKGIQHVGGSEEIREVWECSKCAYVYYKKLPSKE
jgi:rubredoxin